MKLLCLATLLCGASLLSVGATHALALNADGAAGGAAAPIAAKKKSASSKKKSGGGKKKSSSSSNTKLTPHERAWAAVPDHTEPSVAAALKCSACVAVAMEVHHGLSVMDEFRHGACDKYELFETFENSCGRLLKAYGLFSERRPAADVAAERAQAKAEWEERQAKKHRAAEEKAGLPEGGLKREDAPYEAPPQTLADNYLLEFRAVDKFPSVLTDRWVRPMLSTYCGELIDKHDKAILSEFKGMESSDFARQLCIDWEGACEGAPPEEDPEAEAEAAKADDEEMPEDEAAPSS